MCDFHSVVIRVDGALAHVPQNSHSTAVAEAGWRENRPHARRGFVEAEWNGEGKYPGADEICRTDGEELTAKQREACDLHYQALARMLVPGAATRADLLRFRHPEYCDVMIAHLRKGHRQVGPALGWLLQRMFSELLDREPEAGKAFPARAREAIAKDANLEMVCPKFLLWLLDDPATGVIRFAKTESRRQAIQGVSALFRRWLDGDKPPATDWISARKNCWAAYADAYAYAAAAYAAAAAADADAAADAYAYAYAYAAADAYAYAYAAADAYAYAAADAYAYAYAAAADADAAFRKKHWLLMADKIIELIAEASK